MKNRYPQVDNILELYYTNQGLHLSTETITRQEEIKRMVVRSLGLSEFDFFQTLDVEEQKEYLSRNPDFKIN